MQKEASVKEESKRKRPNGKGRYVNERAQEKKGTTG